VGRRQVGRHGMRVVQWWCRQVWQGSGERRAMNPGRQKVRAGGRQVAVVAGKVENRTTP